MDFEQIQQTLRAMAQMHSQELESLRLHSDLLAGIVPALDSLKENAIRHERDMDLMRLRSLEQQEKLDALIRIVDGMIRGGSPRA